MVNFVEGQLCKVDGQLCKKLTVNFTKLMLNFAAKPTSRTRQLDNGRVAAWAEAAARAS